MTTSTWDVDAAVRGYREGRSLQQIADDVGVAATTVRNHLIKRGVELRQAGSGRRRDVDSAEIRWLRNVEGATWGQIAGRIGMTVPGTRSRYLADQTTATDDAQLWAQLFRSALGRHPVIDVATGVERYLHRPPTPAELTAVLSATAEIESSGLGKRAATALGRPTARGRRRRLILARQDAGVEQLRRFFRSDDLPQRKTPLL